MIKGKVEEAERLVNGSGDVTMDQGLVGWDASRGYEGGEEGDDEKNVGK